MGSAKIFLWDLWENYKYRPFWLTIILIYHLPFFTFSVISNVGPCRTLWSVASSSTRQFHTEPSSNQNLISVQFVNKVPETLFPVVDSPWRTQPTNHRSSMAKWKAVEGQWQAKANKQFRFPSHNRFNVSHRFWLIFLTEFVDRFENLTFYLAIILYNWIFKFHLCVIISCLRILWEFPYFVYTNTSRFLPV